VPTSDNDDGTRSVARPDRTGREQDGRFARGRSGNVRGRPRGCRNRSTEAAEALLDGEAETLTRKAIDLALAGDQTMLRVCLERVVPRRRSGRVRLQLPALTRVEDVPSVLGDVLKAAAAGEIDLEDAGTLAALVDRQRQALESRDLAARVEALEILSKRGWE
jgi:hypothetical protein